MSGAKALQASWNANSTTANVLALRGWEPVVASADDNLESVLLESLSTLGLVSSNHGKADHAALNRKIADFVSENLESFKYTIHQNVVNSSLKTESDGSKSITLNSLEPTFLLQLAANAMDVRVDYFQITTPPMVEFSSVSLQTYTFSPSKPNHTASPTRFPRARVAIASLDRKNWCELRPTVATCFPNSFGLKSFTSSPVGVIAIRPDSTLIPTSVEFTFPNGETLSCPLVKIPIPQQKIQLASGHRFFAFIPRWRRFGSQATTRLVCADKKGDTAMHSVSFDTNQSTSFSTIAFPFSDAVGDAYERGFFEMVQTFVESFGTVLPDAPAMPSLAFSGFGSGPRGAVAVRGLRHSINITCLQNAIRDVISYFGRCRSKESSAAGVASSLVATLWSIYPDFKFITNQLFDLITTIVLLGTDKTALVCFENAEHEKLFHDYVANLRDNSALDFASPPTKELFSRASEAVKRGQPEPLCRTCSASSLGDSISSLQQNLGLVVRLDSSSDAGLNPSSSVPVVRFVNFTSGLDNTQGNEVIIHQSSISCAVQDGIVRNFGAAALGDGQDAVAEATFIEKEMKKSAFSACRFLHIGFDGTMETDEVSVLPALPDASELSNINLVALGSTASSPLAWNILLPRRGATPLLVAAAPQHWYHLDFLACVSQLPVTFAGSMYTAAKQSNSAVVGSPSRLSSAFSEPVSAARTRMLRISFATNIQAADKMDVDAVAIKEDADLQAPASKRRKSLPAPSISFDDDVSRRTKKRLSVSKAVDLPFFVPEKPEFIASEPALLLPPLPPPKSQRLAAAQTNAAAATAATAPSPSAAHNGSASKPKREKPPKTIQTSLSSASLAMETTGAIMERQESLIVNSMSATRRGTFYRSVKLFLLRYGFAPFGADLEAYTSFFKFNSVRLFRELVVLIGVRLAQADRETAVAFCKDQLSMTDDDIETAYTLTSVLLFLRYLEADVSSVQAKGANLVQSAFFSPQLKKPTWWNSKMEIRACLWLKENGCPSSWSSELDKTWLHQDFVKDGTSPVPKDWKVIGKELDATFLPVHSMAKRFYALLQFLHSNQIFSSWRAVQQAGDVLFSSTSHSENSVSPSAASLPPAPKRQRHWLVKQDESVIEQEKEFKPMFYIEIAYNLALCYANDVALMTPSVLKDHHIDSLKFCSKISAGEHLHSCAGMIQSQWNDIVQAKPVNKAFPLLGMLSNDVKVAVRMSDVRCMTAGLWKRGDPNRVDLHYGRLTRLYKSESFTKWASANLMNQKSNPFPSKTDVFIILTFLIKYGVPAATEGPLTEAILGEGVNDWRRRKDLKWDEDKVIPQSESQMRSMMKGWLAHLKQTIAPKATSDQGILLVALEMFAKQVPSLLCDVLLQAPVAAKYWKETTLRLGFVLDDDDIADVDYDINARVDNKELSEQDNLTSSNIVEASEVLLPFIEYLVEKDLQKIFHLGSRGVLLRLEEARMMLDITQTRSFRKRVPSIKSYMQTPEMQSILWVNSTDPAHSEIRTVLSSEDVIPTVMELSLILVLFEFGVPQNFERYSKIIGDLLGDETGRTVSRVGLYSVRTNAQTDISRRIRDLDRAWESARSDDVKPIKQQLQTIFAGENKDRVMDALRQLGTQQICDHLKAITMIIRDEGRREIKEVVDESSVDSSLNNGTPASKKRKRE